MTEEDYIQASNLARLRVAREALRGVLLSPLADAAGDIIARDIGNTEKLIEAKLKRFV